MPKPRIIYLNNDEFTAEIVAYQTDKSRENADRLAASFYTLARNAQKYLNIPLDDLDDYIQDAVVHAFTVVDKFDAQRSTAFNYMTAVILNQFRSQFRLKASRDRTLERYWSSLSPDRNTPRTNA